MKRRVIAVALHHSGPKTPTRIIDEVKENLEPWQYFYRPGAMWVEWPDSTTVEQNPGISRITLYFHDIDSLLEARLKIPHFRATFVEIDPRFPHMTAAGRQFVSEVLTRYREGSIERAARRVARAIDEKHDMRGVISALRMQMLIKYTRFEVSWRRQCEPCLHGWTKLRESHPRIKRVRARREREEALANGAA